MKLTRQKHKISAHKDKMTRVKSSSSPQELAQFCIPYSTATMRQWRCNGARRDDATRSLGTLEPLAIQRRCDVAAMALRLRRADGHSISLSGGQYILPGEIVYS